MRLSIGLPREPCNEIPIPLTSENKWCQLRYWKRKSFELFPSSALNLITFDFALGLKRTVTNFESKPRWRLNPSRKSLENVCILWNSSVSVRIWIKMNFFAILCRYCVRKLFDYFIIYFSVEQGTKNTMRILRKLISVRRALYTVLFEKINTIFLCYFRWNWLNFRSVLVARN